MFVFDSSTSRATRARETHIRTLVSTGLATTLAMIAMLFAATSAGAAGLSPQWTVTAVSLPTNFAPKPAIGSSTGAYTVTVVNTGGAASNASAITVKDVLPAGLVAHGSASGKEYIEGHVLSCETKTVALTETVTCKYTGVLVPGDSLNVTIPVEVTRGEGAITNKVAVSGGGAGEASVSTETTISTTPASFGIANGSLATALSSVQAGAHTDLTTMLGFNTVNGEATLADPERSIVAELPPGFAGDLAESQTCPVAAFSELVGADGLQTCPLSTQVGTTTITANVAGAGLEQLLVPVYNLTPNPGEVAKLGFEVAGSFGIQGQISLSPGDYRVRTSFQNIDETAAQIVSTSLTVWGVPASPAHNALRGLVCGGPGGCTFANTREKDVHYNPTGQPSEVTAIPYLTSPTRCTTAPLEATFTSTSWEGLVAESEARSSLGPLTGCGLLEFAPWITVAPDTTDADTPAGLTADVKVPQEGLTSPEGLSSADIQNTKVVLPEGLVINPGQANGLEACQPAQEAIGVQSPPSCPKGSIVGHDEIRSPLLKEKFEGDVYVLQSNPPDVKLLVEASQPIYGIYIKLVGDVHLNETTGQLTTTFEGTPELPFTDFKLSFSGGAQAALSTPTACGNYSTNADFAPWSGESDALVTSPPFAIDSGPGGSACASPLPFGPSMIAGATTDQAGGFTNFSMLLQRADGQQRISTLQFKTPPGLLGVISKVPLCGEAEVVKHECPEGSRIGHTVVQAGPGPYPLVVPQPGQPPAPIYLTGPYEGAPYGLLIKVPLHVGPFTLETQVVRAKIEVDPLTSQLTVTTDPLPTIIGGVPADLRTIDAVIDRSQFMFNPTNCSAQSFSGTATSTEGTSAPISSKFQVGSCRELAFKPQFKVSTSGKTSRANGASLDVKLSYPKGAMGKDANIRSVKVNLPKQLPSRLTTLQKACPAATFNANPASCPKGSKVGGATATTPVLAGVLSGPAYFVSYGGAKFPELVVVLQGDGITVDLHGETFINEKTGITSSTFRQVPDVPVQTFELRLPKGANSALAANGNLCKSKLKMPTAFTAQNGMVIHQSTPIGVTGCTKVRKAGRGKRKK